MTYIGQPVKRVDGIEKVTGKAKYAAEFNVPGLTYGYVVSSGIVKGTITSIDTSEALALPGVLEVFTHENRPKTAWFDMNYKDQDAPPGSPFRPLHDATIKYSGQPIALVVAETFEMARYGASLIKVTYEQEPHETDLEAHLTEARDPEPGISHFLKPLPPKPRGNADEAMAAAPVSIKARHVHGAQHHNPMEMFGTTVEYGKEDKDGKPYLTIYDKTQGAPNSQMYVAQIFDLPFSHVRVISPYVGGGFGSGLRPQYQLFLAVMAAKALKRSVRVTLTRQQMFTFGHRPNTVQEVELGASTNGTITAIKHDAKAATSQFEDYTEVVVNWTGILYDVPDTTLTYKVKSLDIYSPLDMRAPGGVTGDHAIETAMDALAYELGMDPIELRLKNYSEKDWTEGDKPFSSKELRACFYQGAERFGWKERNPEPRSMKRGHNLVGWGMATGIWDASRMFARAEAVLTVNGKLRVSSATADIGTGTYTVMTQIAADTLGMPIDDVIFKLGDTDMPMAPIQGGSWTASTVGSAVKQVCEDLGKKLFKMAAKDAKSPFYDATWQEVMFADGELRLKKEPSVSIKLIDIVALNGGRAVSETSTSMPNPLELKKYSRHTHAAAFVEVEVDEDLGTVTVKRAVTAVAGGRILNPRTARSQIIGGMVWGISSALEEDSKMDHRFGRFMNHNLAEYHVAVAADIHDLDVIFVEEHDDIVNPLGAKGLGEIGIVGMPAAVANAVFHATGKRIYDLPITIDRVLY
ncbi:xanthine dehydrogenase family protein molybdopterin-binding subunit [Fibrivirga algicola]|uniref:Xanthine dehydrogenase family protein molybdopterin-binding subunit n=1 Tax=Fibrivirga algicola TaxID=2950420 RepID=A0ABX0QI76_9BACT|nr:xanthine dehydrogenase family protein molybdopterin-binding subunit [Fibrivirga algicola]NID10956.1 xanthine dehydrogenase family protein molybdopterin-binding subunit [Fibrivirga algicola]